MFEYNCQIARVVDGDTVDVIIDCGFSIFAQGKSSHVWHRHARI